MRFLKWLILLVPPLVGQAQEGAASDRHPLFQDDAVLKAVLTAPISQAYAQRHQEARIYFPGQWTYVDESGETQRLEVSIRTRGHFRREVCDLPPLQLNFKKSQVKGTLFAGQNKLKLVAPCRRGERYQQYVLLEYLAYRMYQILTDHSFTVRLVRLSYVDRDDKLDPWTDFTFVIEDDKDMARRLELDRVNVASLQYSQLNHAQTALVQLFQFLIANNDYSVLRPSTGKDCCHNVELLGVEDEMQVQPPDESVVPVPFDFDFSGLVNASYAAPPSQVPIRDVRFRYFYGLCVPRPILDEAVVRLQSGREAILDLISGTEQLDERLREKNIAFVEDFYEIIGDPETLNEEVVRRCRRVNLMHEYFGNPADEEPAALPTG